MFHSSLKSANTADIEGAIGRAVSDLLGSRYEARIVEMAFGSTEQDQIDDKTKLRLELRAIRTDKTPAEAARELLAMEDGDEGSYDKGH